MTKHEKQTVEAVKEWLAGGMGVWLEETTITALVEIIDRLDKQLTELKEAGEPLEEALKAYAIMLPDPKCNEKSYLKDIEIAAHRLAQALKGVKDGKP